MGGLAEPIRVRHPSTDRTSVENTCGAMKVATIFFFKKDDLFKGVSVLGYRTAVSTNT